MKRSAMNSGTKRDQWGVTSLPLAFDRLAFLLNANGVSLHWMTDGSGPEDAYTGLTADNVLVDKSSQRGKDSLKDHDWNSAELSLKNSVVTLSLNGVVIAVRKLEAENSRQFGFYHDKNATTSVQVRNVVLSGDWPKTLSPEITSQLLATVRERSPAERRAFGATIDEKYHAEGLDQLLIRTRAMSPNDQYEALKAWVLPNDDHVAFRVYGAFTGAQCSAFNESTESRQNRFRRCPDQTGRPSAVHRRSTVFSSFRSGGHCEEAESLEGFGEECRKREAQRPRCLQVKTRDANFDQRGWR